MKIYQCEVVGTSEVKYFTKHDDAVAFARPDPRVRVTECTLHGAERPELQELLAELSTWCDIRASLRVHR